MTFTMLRLEKYNDLIDAFRHMKEADAHGNVKQFKAAADALRRAYSDYIKIKPVSDAFRSAIEFYINE